MENLTTIALRRLDGAYLSPNTMETPSLKSRALLKLLGYVLTSEAQLSFDSTGTSERNALLDALLGKLPDTMISTLRNKAGRVGTLEALAKLTVNNPTVLREVRFDELGELFGRLVTQPLPYSEQDSADLKVLAAVFPIGELKAEIRENNAVLAGLIPSYDWTRSMTVTDALRVAAVWSGGDQTLEVAPRFRLKRSQRRAISLAVEEVLLKSDYAYFDFARNRELWKRLFTALHVGDYNVPRLQAAASMLFEGQLSSLDSMIEYLVKEKDIDGLLVHLKTMPGVFARRLHELIRKMPDKRSEIVSEFAAVAPRISTRVLIQLRNYYTGPSKTDSPNIPFAGKSRSARDGFLENRKVGDYSDVIFAIDAALGSKLVGKKIFLGEGGDKIGVLTSNRSTAMGSRAVARGSRIPVGDGAKFINLFTHWKNLEDGGRVDLDISGLFLSDDLASSEHLSYYSTESAHARYSGDITDAPNGAEEYISVDLDHAKRRGFRYMAIVINSYTGQSIDSIPECYSGIAVGDSLNFQGFDASAVKVRFDISAAGREVIPFLFDLDNLELIWTDLAAKGASSGASMLNSGSLGSLLKFILSNQGITVGELVEKSGAILVTDEDEADISIDPRMSDQVAQLFG